MDKFLQEWLDDALAVLVLYKLPLQQSPTYNSLSAALKESNLRLDWFIYDNSEEPQFELPHSSAITYVVDISNVGVSHAYNKAFFAAKQRNKKWMLLLDQDSIFPENTFEEYYQALKLNPAEFCFVPQLLDKKGIISPFKALWGNGWRLSSVKVGIHKSGKTLFVNSGMMISVDAFSKTGGYDERFPLDFSDFAFQERFRKKYIRFVVVPVVVNHGFSDSTQMPLPAIVQRFRQYLKASSNFRKIYYPFNYLIIWRAWFRGVRLSVRYRSCTFIKALINAS